VGKMCFWEPCNLGEEIVRTICLASLRNLYY
jgi:hypothetical protein